MIFYTAGKGMRIDLEAMNGKVYFGDGTSIANTALANLKYSKWSGQSVVLYKLANKIEIMLAGVLSNYKYLCMCESLP